MKMNYVFRCRICGATFKVPVSRIYKGHSDESIFLLAASHMQEECPYNYHRCSETLIGLADVIGVSNIDED